MPAQESILSERFDIDGMTVTSGGWSEQQGVIRARVLDKMRSGHYGWETTPCYCGSRDVEPISRIDKHCIPVSIVVCRKCGLIFQSPRLGQEALAEFYREEYRELYNPGFQGCEAVYRANLDRSEECRRILTSLPEKPELVYEVGAHFGALMQAFREAGCEVAGTDYDESGMAFAREGLGLDNALVGPSSALLGLGRQADLLIYIHVLEHINDLDAELSMARRLLRDGGRLYLSVPGAVAWAAKKGGMILNTLQLAHTWYFTLDHLAYVAERNGFYLESGNEMVEAVFRKGSVPERPVSAPDKYATVVGELRAMDKAWRRATRPRPVRAFVGRVLRKFGLRRS